MKQTDCPSLHPAAQDWAGPMTPGRSRLRGRGLVEVGSTQGVGEAAFSASHVNRARFCPNSEGNFGGAPAMVISPHNAATTKSDARLSLGQFSQWCTRAPFFSEPPGLDPTTSTQCALAAMG